MFVGKCKQTGATLQINMYDRRGKTLRHGNRGNVVEGRRFRIKYELFSPSGQFTRQ